MNSQKMKPSAAVVFLVLVFVAYCCETTYAIYDPRETRPVKPAKHRELVIPWYLSQDSTEPSVDLGLWTRRPVVVNDGAQTYKSQHAVSGEIEQQSITSFEKNYEQSQNPISGDDFQQIDDFNLINENDNENYEENGWFVDNDDHHEPYEDFAIESNKPYKDTKDFTAEPVPSVKTAKYDSETGPECPTPDATGQFVYPPDCRSFVNCWNGRAFVQNCAPGTLFNPETLECDFPIKVKCYTQGTGEITNSDIISPPIRKHTLRVAGSRTESEVPIPDQNPSCPRWVTGLLPHPSDCTKFLQCANGGTFIMDCGPGTVFNPTVSVCDWPYNVAGCEDALLPKVETTTHPIWENIYWTPNVNEGRPQLPVQSNIVKCPDGQEGLLPHPKDCKKFLQCNNGNTHVMDCGPGTVFNPAISVCDFPYNVEGCGAVEDRSVTDSSQIGVDSHVENTREQNSYGQSNQHNTDFGYTTHSVYVPYIPRGQRAEYPTDDQSYNQNNNNGRHGSGYPNRNLHQHDNNNHNYARPHSDIDEIAQQRTESPQHNTNQNIYPYNYPNQGQSHNHHDSEGSYSHVSEVGHTNVRNDQPQNQFLPHRNPYNQNGFSGNTYVDSNYRLPGEVQKPNENESHRGRFPTIPVWNNRQPSRTAPSTTTPTVTTPQRWNQEETNVRRPGQFAPSNWRGEHEVFESPVNLAPQHPSLKGSIHPHTITTDLDLDSKLDRWTTKTHVFNRTHNNSGTKTPSKGMKFFVTSNIKNSTYPKIKNSYPSGIYVNVDGIPGHYITREIEINQGHSNTRQYHNKNGVNASEGAKDYHTTTDRNTLNVAIEFDNGEENRERLNKTNINVPVFDSNIPVEADTVHEDIDDHVESQENNRKPKLIFENKTEQNTKASNIMKINSEKIDLNIFDVEPIHNTEEPPFPVYYVPPVLPINYLHDAEPIVPISGQVLRLRGGSVLGEGYLEVQGVQSGWGIVCDRRNEWTLKEANVICRQLGYTRGAETAWQGHSMDDTPTWIAADSVRCVGNETYFQSCIFTHNSECDVARDSVGIRCLPNRAAYCGQDEVPHRGYCYHLADSDTALNHAEALEYCNNKGSKLLDVVDQSENNFISEWLVQQHPDVNSVMTSGFGFTTLNRTIWLWEDSNRAKFRFSKWWLGWMSDKQTPPSVGTRPACVVMKRIFPCHNRPDEACTSDYFFWEVEDCAASSKGHSYICKRAYNDIGCTYGKGQHYSGKANITASGSQCLSWGDEAVQQYLNFKVVSVETREKLKEHNYCRNPNPNRAIKPWCFTGLNGEHDQCDIPPCAKQGTKKSIAAGQCKPKHFECTPGECIPSPWICDGEEDCTNGADEHACSQHLEFYTKTEQHRLDGYDLEKWLNTPLKTCALRCKEADFTCRSFSHKSDGNVCFLSDSNIGLSGALQPSADHDYYEMNDRSIDCNNMFVCGNRKCINQSLVCDGKNNCGDRTDESTCQLENLGYEIRLGGSSNPEEGRVEVKAWGQWGHVCDDGFNMIAASVVCKELGFVFGAREVRPSGFYGKGESSLFLMDQIKCRGNETSLRECDFDGWGVHNCLPEENVGIVCKTAVNTCPDGSWKCDNSPECIPAQFICDEVVDCGDGSDEAPSHCEAPFELRLEGGSSSLEGRVEVRHHGIWGTVCDDDFSSASATVICRSLGFGGTATAIKDGGFGPGEGPIWLDEVSCIGNETQLYRCQHDHWGRHNCDHSEDVGVHCEYGDVVSPEPSEVLIPYVPEITANDILPTDCGMRAEDFDVDDEYMARVVHGSIAPKGAYPWQASLRVRGHSKSSHWCGAVIISPLYVLTAAHCLEGYNKGMYFVRAGDHNTEVDEGTEIEANIEDYYVHEDFRKGQRMNNDIALVLLKGRGIPLGRNIMPICLPPENIEYLPGLNCTISGWGSIESGNSVQSNFLRFGWVPILDQSVCRSQYVYGEGSISDGMVCAGYLDEGVDSCDGDSGGPLACLHNNAFTLYGLTSWGKHCGEANKPGVYVRIGHYRRWIDQKIRESSSGM